jgi:hypothetical protein
LRASFLPYFWPLPHLYHISVKSWEIHPDSCDSSSTTKPGPRLYANASFVTICQCQTLNPREVILGNLALFLCSKKKYFLTTRQLFVRKSPKVGCPFRTASIHFICENTPHLSPMISRCFWSSLNPKGLDSKVTPR